MDIAWRHLTLSDLKDWAGLLETIEQTDIRGENFDVEDLRAQLDDTVINVASDTLAGFTDQGMAAYGIIRSRRTRQGFRAVLDGGVLPGLRRSGTGGRIVEWARTWAEEQCAELPPGASLELQSRVSDRNPGHAVLMLSQGFSPVRWFHDLECTFPDGLTGTPVPEGNIVTAYTEQLGEAARRAWNDVFGTAAGGMECTPESWQRLTHAPAFRPELSFVMCSRISGEVIGVLLADYYPADTAMTGVREVWIQSAGARRSARGTGVMAGLLSHACHAYHEKGYQRAALSVHTDEPRAESGVHEQAGFRRTHTWAVYTRTFSGSDPES
ncbi:GNAT family N-acetyltransferase [Streptomyces sp. NPDC058045]|uniref:GNAT family N-acetyltransferase n=1 Tax=Streptomyces sp. NPDC058045 TaxID=3346311 RepID=UPI0036EB6F9F